MTKEEIGKLIDSKKFQIYVNSMIRVNSVVIATPFGNRLVTNSFETIKTTGKTIDFSYERA